jgi:isopropylmalate/homocitrate/citramalate synthase
MHPDVIISEVGPRDGLQNEPETLKPSQRGELITRLVDTGLRRIEAVSFVRDDVVPQMAGAEAVLDEVAPTDRVDFLGLVLNQRGLGRCQTTMCRPNLTLCVTDTFNQRNQRATVSESLAQVAGMAAAAHRNGQRVTVTLAASFGCPFEGAVSTSHVMPIAEGVAAAGADEIVFADTIGVATPSQIRSTVRAALGLHVPVGLHLHNTRNTGYVNAFAGIEAGATILDSSVGGIGGCPFAPGATGNIATEDLLYLLDQEGVQTGVDIHRVIEASHWLGSILGRRLPGQLHAVGVGASYQGLAV